MTRDDPPKWLNADERCARLEKDMEKLRARIVYLEKLLGMKTPQQEAGR